ncbi:MAG: tkt [Solirubrobacterales bacterium]|jgi:transketolase|nr:tkt [Solirubrobacterales bacterium]
MTEHAEQLCIDTIRTLSMDAIEEAGSGHPGLPLGMAPAAYLLYAKVMKHDPQDPTWPDRDRFILSAGHGSMLLYSALHLSGYDLPLDELKKFRLWGSLTPGHPERDRVHVTPGVEVTTGPLGQGFANGVGLAMAEAFLRDKFGPELQDHFTYAIVSDGDLMEGIAAEAASLAGQLGLGKLIYLYDDNDISLDGPTSLSFDREDVSKRFESYGWQVLEQRDANDIDGLEAQIELAKAETSKPTLIHVHSIIGYPSPNKQGTSKAHGAALGEEEVRLTKEVMGWDPDARFLVPDGVYETFGAAGRRGAEAHAAWNAKLEEWRAANPDDAAVWDAAWAGKPMPGVGDALRELSFSKDKLATRVAGKESMAAFSDFVPTMVGGAADLSGSTNTEFPGGADARFTAEQPDRNVFWGVREHGMGGAVNGLAAHGGILRPYGSTFLQFSDYMRGAIRLSALTGLPCAWVFTHDSIALGSDGPTHQPVEHLAALRAIPGLVVLRPADPRETAEAWRVILEDLEGPALLALSRQGLPVLTDSPNDVGRGAYVLRDGAGPVIVGTGAEVHVALAAAEELGADVDARVVSFPSWELFEQQDEAYRESVLPKDRLKVSVEALVTQGWHKWVDHPIGLDRFGASADGDELLERFGFTGPKVAEVVRGLM